MSIQILRGSSAKIKSSTVVPKAGQPLYATDTHELYVGDGTTQAKNLTGIVGEATNTLKSDVAALKSTTTTLRSDVTTLQTTDTKLKAKQSVSNANNYILGGDLNWLKLPNNTVPTFEVNTSTGELVIKINGADTNVPSSLSVAITTNDTDINSTVNSWGHVVPASYDSLFDRFSGSYTVLISDGSIDANLGSNMNMITESEEPIDWVTAINSKLGSNGVSIMPNSLAVKLYNSSSSDLVQYTTYGLLRDQALGLPTKYSMQMPIDNVYQSASDVVANSGTAICVVNWPKSLQYSSIDTSAIATECVNIVNDFMSKDITLVLSMYCANDELYQTIANDIINNTGVDGYVLLSTDDVFREIGKRNHKLYTLNPAHTIAPAAEFAQSMIRELSGCALIFYDDSTNAFNTAVLQGLGDFIGKGGYTVYITDKLRRCYDKIQTPQHPFNLFINNKTQFMHMIEINESNSNAFSKIDNIVLGAELALSMIRAKGGASSCSQAVSDQLLDVDVCRDFLKKMAQEGRNVEYATNVQYVKGSEATTIPTTTTIKKITVKQSKSY